MRPTKKASKFKSKALASVSDDASEAAQGAALLAEAMASFRSTHLEAGTPVPPSTATQVRWAHRGEAAAKIQAVHRGKVAQCKLMQRKLMMAHAVAEAAELSETASQELALAPEAAQAVAAPMAPDAMTAWKSAAYNRRHFTAEYLLQSVESGAIAPLSGRWLVSLWKGDGRLKPRQQLPPEAFLSATALRRLASSLGDDYGLLFVTLSYKWLGEEHPASASGMWHVHVACNMWHVACGTWHVACACACHGATRGFVESTRRAHTHRPCSPAPSRGCLDSTQICRLPRFYPA